MSNGSSSSYVGACRKDIPYPSVSSESVPSLIDNLVYALYGTITKSVINRRVVWNIPCDPNNTALINGIPRNTDEGLLCYIVRALNLTTPSGFVTVNGVQTLTNKTLTAPVINSPSISNLTATGTLALPAGSVTSAMIADGTIVNADINASAAIVASKLAPVTSTGSTTARTLENRFADVVNVKDFGAVGNGVTDDTAALQAAVTFAGNQGGGTVYIPSGMKLLIDSGNIVLPRYVSIQSDFLSFSFQESNQNTRIILNPSYTIRINGIGCSLKGLMILRKGLTRSTNAPASFSGKAVTIESLTGGLTDDAYIGNCHISGFEYAIWGNLCGRYEFFYITGDNTNGIYTKEVYDVGRISDCHFWPFFTSGTGGSAYRTGTAYTFDAFNDWSQAHNCFCLGYETGFKVLGNSVRLIGCGVDGSLAQSIGGTSKGFHITGSAIDTQLIGCQSAARHTNYYFDSTQHNTMTACAGWGSVPNHVRIEDGSVYVNGSHFYNTTTDAAIKVGVNTDWVKIDGCSFNAVGQVYSINNAAKYKTDILTNNVYRGSSTGISNDTSRKIAVSGEVGYSNYSIGGANGFQTRNYLATGSTTTPTAVSSGLALGSYRFFGHDGTNFLEVGIMRCGVAGSVSTGIVPATFIFTTYDESGVGADRLSITPSGNFVPVTDNSYTLGQSGNRWSAVWAANGTIQTSDERTKKDIADSPLGLDFIEDLRPVSYRFKVGSNKVIRQVYRDADGNEVDSNAEGANPAEIITEEVAGERVHYGLLAQQVKEVLPAGVDFGGWILTDKNDPDSEQGLRYEEFISPLIKAVQELSEQNKSLVARIEALEAAN